MFRRFLVNQDYEVVIGEKFLQEKDLIINLLLEALDFANVNALSPMILDSKGNIKFFGGYKSDNIYVLKPQNKANKNFYVMPSDLLYPTCYIRKLSETENFFVTPFIRLIENDEEEQKQHYIYSASNVSKIQNINFTDIAFKNNWMPALNSYGCFPPHASGKFFDCKNYALICVSNYNNIDFDMIDFIRHFHNDIRLHIWVKDISVDDEKRECLQRKGMFVHPSQCMNFTLFRKAYKFIIFFDTEIALSFFDLPYFTLESKKILMLPNKPDKATPKFFQASNICDLTLFWDEGKDKQAVLEKIFEEKVNVKSTLNVLVAFATYDKPHFGFECFDHISSLLRAHCDIDFYMAINKDGLVVNENLPKNFHVIEGDNGQYEFSAWQKILDLNRHRLSRYDVIILLNDTVYSTALFNLPYYFDIRQILSVYNTRGISGEMCSAVVNDEDDNMQILDFFLLEGKKIYNYYRTHWVTVSRELFSNIDYKCLYYKSLDEHIQVDEGRKRFLKAWMRLPKYDKIDKDKKMISLLNEMRFSYELNEAIEKILHL